VALRGYVVAGWTRLGRSAASSSRQGFYLAGKKILEVEKYAPKQWASWMLVKGERLSLGFYPTVEKAKKAAEKDLHGISQEYGWWPKIKK